ncbi:MAG: hypothetical protein QOG14_300 [Mycobacterium sp.]|nr:hypothetical protein [Mycobacterium sp.]
MSVSLAAGATVQSIAAEAAWLVPAITATATLLGTAVGGAMTFWTTRSANIRQEKAAEKRRKLDEIKDVSIRFIRLLSNQGYESMRLKQRADDLQSLALQKMLGHKSAKMTLDTYGDLFDDDLDAVALRLHAKYSPDAPGAQAVAKDA